VYFLEEEQRDDLYNPYWIEDNDLRKCKQKSLEKREETFWVELIKRYLEPIIDNPKKQVRII